MGHFIVEGNGHSLPCECGLFDEDHDVYDLNRAEFYASAAVVEEKTPSMFYKFGGYYSVMFDGVEYARFAPSSAWTAYCKLMEKSSPDFSYKFVKTED